MAYRTKPGARPRFGWNRPGQRAKAREFGHRGRRPCLHGMPRPVGEEIGPDRSPRVPPVSEWLPVLPPLVLCVAIVLVPGAAMAYAVGLRGIAAWGVAPEPRDDPASPAQRCWRRSCTCRGNRGCSSPPPRSAVLLAYLARVRRPATRDGCRRGMRRATPSAPRGSRWPGSASESCSCSPPSCRGSSGPARWSRAPTPWRTSTGSGGSSRRTSSPRSGPRTIPPTRARSTTSPARSRRWCRRSPTARGIVVAANLTAVAAAAVFWPLGMVALVRVTLGRSAVLLIARWAGVGGVHGVPLHPHGLGRAVAEPARDRPPARAARSGAGRRRVRGAGPRAAPAAGGARHRAVPSPDWPWRIRTPWSRWSCSSSSPSGPGSHCSGGASAVRTAAGRRSSSSCSPWSSSSACSWFPQVSQQVADTASYDWGARRDRFGPDAAGQRAPRPPDRPVAVGAARRDGDRAGRLRAASTPAVGGRDVGGVHPAVRHRVDRAPRLGVAADRVLVQRQGPDRGPGHRAGRAHGGRRHAYGGPAGCRGCWRRSPRP